MSLNIFAYNHIIDKLSTIIKSNKEQIKGGNFFIKTYYGQGSYLLQKTKIKRRRYTRPASLDPLYPL